MTEATRKVPAAAASQQTAQIPEDLAIEIRRLAHDLSNALEIIVQTSYLLNMAELKPPADDWMRMLDSGVSRALEINLQLREYIKSHTPR
jgi:hypothetical protein